MRAAQKLIKFFALCLAAVIIVGIFAAIVGAFALVGRIVGVDDGFSSGEFSTLWEGDAEDTSEITKLVVKTGATNAKLRLTNENQIKVDTNNEYIATRQIGNTLFVEESSHFAFSSWFDSAELVLYLPEKLVLTDVEINAGAGALEIERLVVRNLDLDLGAGKTKIRELNVAEGARINSGAGVVEVDQGKINNLRLELGAGKTEVRAELIGKSKVESGVGRLDLVLLGHKDDYRFSVDKGIGSVRIDGAEQSDDAVYGQGERTIDLESGVGAIEVKFEQ